MKIIHIINSLNQGGAEKYLINLCSKDFSNRHIIISFKKGFLYKYAIDKKVNTNIINLNNLNLFASLYRVYNLIKSIDPDVINVWLYKSIFYFSLINIFFIKKKIIWWIRTSLNIDDLNNTKYLFIRSISLLSYLFPSNILFNSEKAKISHLEFGFKSNISSVIYNFCDTNSYFYKEDKKNSNNRLILGSVIRYDDDKDIKTLLKSVRELKYIYNIDFILTIVGENINNSKLIKNIQNLKLEKNIKLLNSHDNLNNFYNSIDAHILTSINESFPNVVLDSLASGTFNIVTDVGDVNKIVTKYDKIVKKRDYKAISKILSNLSQNPDNYNSKKIKLYRSSYIIRNFSFENINNEYKEVWNIDVISNKNKFT